MHNSTRLVEHRSNIQIIQISLSKNEFLITDNLEHKRCDFCVSKIRIHGSRIEWNGGLSCADHALWASRGVITNIFTIYLHIICKCSCWASNKEYVEK